MKIIDLLVKNSKGEEVPKKFRYDNNIFVYDEKNKDYVYSNGNVSFFTDYFPDIYHLEDVLMILNDEVEIIEEEKEIEKLSFCDFAITINENASNNDRILMDKINEIIDVINDMRDKE